MSDAPTKRERIAALEDLGLRLGRVEECEMYLCPEEAVSLVFDWIHQKTNLLKAELFDEMEASDE